jgi:hypothetical protein
LTFSTIMTVFLVPSYLQIREDLRAMFAWIFRKFSRQPAVQPAVVTPAAQFDPFETTFSEDEDFGFGAGLDFDGVIKSDLPVFGKQPPTPEQRH